MRYQLNAAPSATIVALDGDLTEGIEEPLAGLLAALNGTGTLSFDCAKVRHINSVGARLWVNFLKASSRTFALQFFNCSTVFMGYALMIRGMIGGGKIFSFYASFTCDKCRLNNQTQLQSKQVVRGTLPRPLCRRCGEIMESDLNEGQDLDLIMG